MGSFPSLAARPLVAAVVLGQLYLAYLALLAWSVGQMPERVAGHFGLTGRADRWMGRTGYLLSMTLLGLGLPLVLVVLTALPGLSLHGINLPHRDFWLAPERIGETRAFLLAHSLWFGCLALSFLAGIHFLVVRANRQAPPRLSMPLLLLLLACFVGGILGWQASLTGHFRREPTPRSNAPRMLRAYEGGHRMDAVLNTFNAPRHAAEPS
jgi:hypothetical protein